MGARVKELNIDIGKLNTACAYEKFIVLVIKIEPVQRDEIFKKLEFLQK